MPHLTRRDLIKASAGAAAIAVPGAALVGSEGIAQGKHRPLAIDPSLGDPSLDDELWDDDGDDAGGPMMFFVHDAELGEVSILQGTSEVVVNDHRLVQRLMATSPSRKI